MPAWSRFVGGKGLGSNLNASMTAKANIVDGWLWKMFGVHTYLVQGSPSYSSASGGVHAGPGDSGDWVYRYANGANASAEVYIVASLMWRLLDCVSYLRGMDLNHDGRKDDSFDQHDHVLDMEGAGKVQAAKSQIAEYRAHQDGLVGHAADREALVTTVMTLALYDADLFIRRLNALSPAASDITAHVQPTSPPLSQEEDMLATASDIKNWYESICNRTPDPDEVDAWWRAGAGVDSGKVLTVQELRAKFVASEETKKDTIVETFGKWIKRPVAQSDIDGWMKTGLNADVIRRLIENSPESAMPNKGI